MVAQNDRGDLVSAPVLAACDAVASLFPDHVVTPQTKAFSDAQRSFWNARQQQKTPACIFQPTSAEQVKAAIIEVARAGCPFAIKGIGHSVNPDGSSIHAGFLFDLAKLNHIEISNDKKTLRVGPGVAWGPLFRVLEKEGVIAVGGRDYGVGVPGFVFGGGISYYSAEHGWGVDNLVSVDMVLANGDLVTVDKDSHADLNKALHGGGAHNFGIATNLTLKLHPYSGMWGGMHVVEEEHFDNVFAAYDQYTRDLSKDCRAHMIMDFWRNDGKMTAAQFMGYTAPVADPPIFDTFRQIPSVRSTLRLADNSSLAEEMAEVTDCRGKRITWWTFCMEYDIDLLKAAFTLWTQMTEPYADHFRTAFDVNHITPAMRNKAAREDMGNVYGLEGPDEPLTNILLTGQCEHESDDAVVTEVLRSVANAIEAEARKRGRGCSFKYMNYAHYEQDVIAAFGEKNKEFLNAVSARYDPEGVFQKLQPGALKLELAAVKRAHKL